MKKYIKLILFFVLCCSLAGCNKSDNSSAEIVSASLLDEGDIIISTMSNMAISDDYKELVGVTDDMESAVTMITSGDYKKPLHIYEIHIPDSRLESIASMGQEVSLDNLSEGLKDNVKNKLFAALANQINARYYGAMYLAVSSMYICNQVFVNTELTENKLYLYTFEKGCPIMISFVKGDNGAVLATGNFIMYNQLDNTDEAVADMVKDTLYLSDSLIDKIK